MNKRLKILLCNDDGIQASGLRTLWESLHASNYADLFVIAPLTERSGAGVSVSWDRPILIQKYDWPAKTPAWSVDGTPADCVKLAVRVILDFIPDLIVSGINAGSNAGRNVLHSGTVGAVIEGLLRGIPGLALSCENGSSPNFHVAQKYIIPLIDYCISHPLPPGCFLNVNFPHAAQKEVSGFRMTRQGKGRWSENPYLHIDTESGPSYWMGGKAEEFTEDEDCDITLLQQGFLTAVPIHIHELTDRTELTRRQNEFESFFSKNEVLLSENLVKN